MATSDRRIRKVVSPSNEYNPWEGIEELAKLLPRQTSDSGYAATMAGERGRGQVWASGKLDFSALVSGGGGCMLGSGGSLMLS